MQKSVASAIVAVVLVAMVAMVAMVAVTPASAQGPLDGNTPADRHKAGHSKLGEAFDEGPRERPSRMDGIGRSHFPITTSNPEVQQWFDQGIQLLYGFNHDEAMRRRDGRLVCHVHR